MPLLPHARWLKILFKRIFAKNGFIFQTIKKSVKKNGNTSDLTIDAIDFWESENQEEKEIDRVWVVAQCIDANSWI